MVKGFKLCVKSNLNLQGSPCGFVLNLNKHRSHIKQKTILSRISNALNIPLFLKTVNISRPH